MKPVPDVQDTKKKDKLSCVTRVKLHFKIRIYYLKDKI